MFKRKAKAIAYIKGSSYYSGLTGTVSFYDKGGLVLLKAELSGLPKMESGFFGFHIHEGEECNGEGFSVTKGHYNPEYTSHPRHAGDLPPILSASGVGYSEVLTDRFMIKDIIGRTVVIHKNPDDFISQPAGNAGEKIACGKIKGVA